MKRKNKKNEIIENLNENEGGYSDIGYSADYSSYGGLGGGPFYQAGSLYKAFVQPFVDIIGVTVGKTKELARRTITLLQVTFEALMSALIPILSGEYEEIFAQEASDLREIENQYSEYYKASREAVGPGTLALAMLAFPGPTLLAKAAADGPRAARGLLSVATGGLSDEYLYGSRSKKSSGPKGSGIFDSRIREYTKIILEAEDKEQEEKSLAAKIANKKFINAMISRSPMISAAAKDAQEIYKNTLNSAFEQARSVLMARDIETIEKAIGEKIKEADDLKKLSPAEKMKAEVELLKTVKKSAKAMYIARLEKQVEPAVEAFGDDHPFVLGYKDVISKIRAL